MTTVDMTTDEMTTEEMTTADMTTEEMTTADMTTAMTDVPTTEMDTTMADVTTQEDTTVVMTTMMMMTTTLEPCVPRDDCFGHFNCNNETDERICLEGWEGPDCTDPVGFDGPSPFDPNCPSNGLCLEGSTCFNGTCCCPPGFTGATCNIDINDCQPNPCMFGGICQDMVDDFMCFCRQNFTGKRCQFTDLEPCIPRDDCTGHVFCAGPFAEPECLDGWTGLPDCTDSTFAGLIDPECPPSKQKTTSKHLQCKRKCTSV